MNPHDDHPQQIKADLLAWLKQNDAEGSAWFLDEGPPAEVAAVALPAAEPAAAPVSAPAAPESEDPFDAECQAFVARTLESIDRQGGKNDRPVVPGTPEEALAQLRQTVQSCTLCALHAGRTQTVFGAGSGQAEVLFIGEAPGRDEDLQGEPFVGRSGQLLTKIIGAIGFSRDDVYICNILKCRPPNNRDPLPEEVACCESFLKQQLAIIQPRVICCLGRIAAQTLLKTEASLGSLRQNVHFYEGVPVMATYHPAALLRNPGWKRETWNDVRKLRALHDALSGSTGSEGQ